MGPLLGLLKKNWNFCRRPYVVCRRARRKKKTAPKRRKRLFFRPPGGWACPLGQWRGGVGVMGVALPSFPPPSPIRPPNRFNGVWRGFNGQNRGFNGVARPSIPPTHCLAQPFTIIGQAGGRVNSKAQPPIYTPPSHSIGNALAMWVNGSLAHPFCRPSQPPNIGQATAQMFWT
jgi:hypothetical protein